MFYKHRHIKGEHMEFYQLKITRKGTKPPIWRRCLIPADINFEKLAEMLQNTERSTLIERARDAKKMQKIQATHEVVAACEELSA